MSGISRRAVLAGGIACGGAVLAPSVAYAKPGGPLNGWVTSTLNRLSRDQLVGQLFVQYVYGSAADSADARNVPLYGVSTPAEVVRKYQLGGVIYFAWSDNVANPTQIAQLSNGLQAAAPTVNGGRSIPLHISTDQEMGVVTRIGPPATQFPGSMALGATRDEKLARTAAAITGEELRAVGVNVNFAPVADVNVNALNPVIGVRSFSSDPELVAGLVAAQVHGFQDDSNVSSSAKHFPGHGDTATDSHTGLPVITHSRAEWEKVDAPPFKAAIAAGIDMIMSAHLVMPAFDDSGDPATLSKPIITGLLRDELGFDGVVITDGLMMQGVRDRYSDGEVAVRALEAGCDQLLMAPEMDEAWNAVQAALDSGRLTIDQLKEKVRRILTLKYRRGLVAAPLVDVSAVSSVVGTAEHQAMAAALTDRTITLVKNDAGLLPLKPEGRTILVTGYGVTTTQMVADALKARGASVTVMQTGTAPSATVRGTVVAAAKNVDVVVDLTNNAAPGSAQALLMQALLATGTPVVAVAVRNPYDINAFPAAPTYVCTYSYSTVSTPALVRVLAGEVKPTGKLPVDIPNADHTGVLYPFGHGLSF